MKDWTDIELQDIAQMIYWALEAQPGEPVKILRDLLSEARAEAKEEERAKIRVRVHQQVGILGGIMVIGAGVFDAIMDTLDQTGAAEKKKK